MAREGLVLVTGATGKQGGAVARALVSRGYPVSALTRTPDSPPARRVAEAGSGIVRGDFDDPASLVAAMQGVDTVFVMGTPFEAGPETETRQGVALIEAAEETGVGHVIYSSVAGGDQRTGVPHFDSKYAVEQRLAQSKCGWTVVAPTAFMDFLAPHFLEGLSAGELRMPLPASRALQYVAVDDIGAVVAELTERREAAFGQRIELAGDERTGEQAAAVLSRASGRDIRYAVVPLDVIRSASEDLALMFDWLDRVGYQVDRNALRNLFPDVHWHTLEGWAADQDWAHAHGPLRGGVF